MAIVTVTAAAIVVAVTIVTFNIGINKVTVRFRFEGFEKLFGDMSR
jgi:hypothetical protein